MADLSSIANVREFPSSRIGLLVENRVAHIILNNPPLNALTIPMLNDISEAIHQADQEPGVCAVVFQPAPKTRAFSVGIGLDEHRPEVAYQMLEALHNVFRNLDFYAKPTMAIVPDSALGAGCALAGYCDFVIAAERARFGLPEIKMGLFPTVASVYFPKFIGERKTRELIMTGSLLSAQEAYEIGLVNYVVSDDHLESKAIEVVDRLRSMSAAVLEASRRALSEIAGKSTIEAFEHVEDIYLNQLLNMRDPGEGLIAVMEKRAPRWKHK